MILQKVRNINTNACERNQLRNVNTV